MDQTNNLYNRMKDVEEQLNELNSAILKVKQDLEEELYALYSKMDALKGG